MTCKHCEALEGRIAALEGKPNASIPEGTRPVLVTTAHRGVFFGYATDTTGETISLKRARLCVYWSADMKGFMGLSSHGPSDSCRIGPPSDITLRNIAAVVEVSTEAVTRFENAPWK